MGMDTTHDDIDDGGPDFPEPPITDFLHLLEDDELRALCKSTQALSRIAWKQDTADSDEIIALAGAAWQEEQRRRDLSAHQRLSELDTRRKFFK